MSKHRHRLYVARLAAILFFAVGGYKTQQAISQGNLMFYADAVLYLGLAVIWNEHARKENHH